MWIRWDCPFLYQPNLILGDEYVWRVDHTIRVGFKIGDARVGKANLPTVAAFVKQRPAHAPHAPLFVYVAYPFDLGNIEMFGHSGTLKVLQILFPAKPSGVEFVTALVVSHLWQRAEYFGEAVWEGLLALRRAGNPGFRPGERIDEPPLASVFGRRLPVRP